MVDPRTSRDTCLSTPATVEYFTMPPFPVTLPARSSPSAVPIANPSDRQAQAVIYEDKHQIVVLEFRTYASVFAAVDLTTADRCLPGIGWL
jgi:hypothetical protein